MFSEKEIAYLKSQRLARIATVSADGEPDAAAVGFTFNGEHFLVGGHDLRRTLKYKNVLATERAALVIDDLIRVNPWGATRDQNTWKGANHASRRLYGFWRVHRNHVLELGN